MAELQTGGGSLEQGSGATEGSVQAWQELVDGQVAFLLAYEIAAYREPKPVILDPASGQSLVVERSTRLKRFDLTTGLQLSEQEILYLQNGQILGGGDPTGSIQYIYHETLPAALAQVFSDTATRVREELGK